MKQRNRKHNFIGQAPSLMLIVFSVVVVVILYDLSLWPRTLKRIERISSTKGLAVSDTLKYLEENRERMGIVDVQECQSEFGGNDWILVELKSVSILGILLSWICPDDWLGALRISGTLSLNTEAGRVSSCEIVF